MNKKQIALYVLAMYTKGDETMWETLPDSRTVPDVISPAAKLWKKVSQYKYWQQYYKKDCLHIELAGTEHILDVVKISESDEDGNAIYLSWDCETFEGFISLGEDDWSPA